MAQRPPGNHCDHQGIIAISTKISSPANIFPNNRKANEKGLTNSSNILKAIFKGNNQGPKGRVKISLPKCQPFIAKLKKMIKTKTEIDIAKVMLGSAVGTILKWVIPNKFMRTGK